MTDVLFIATLAAFFAVCVLFVRACDRIIGHETVVADTPEPAGKQQAAA
ncbi:MAG: hypothetical protein JOZ99_15340 [Actinobacteria bacterium]|nr:hypothetical protein [Actinomycetota bacterium]